MLTTSYDAMSVEKNMSYEDGIVEGVRRCTTHLMMNGFDRAAGFIEDHVPMDKFLRDASL